MTLKDKKIVFCIPGSHVSVYFMQQLVDLIDYCRDQGAQTKISTGTSSMVSQARINCLNGNPDRGLKQKPFSGEPYDYIMWIDTDIQFNNECFQKLVDHDRDIVAGWYMIPDAYMGREFASSVLEPYYFNEGGMELGIKMISIDDIKSRDQLFQCRASGLGWMLVRQGVFEKLPFPWFAPKIVTANGVPRLTGEDVAFCMDAQAAGFDIWVDPAIKVNHEKTVIV
jgi:hypothetical protein